MINEVIIAVGAGEEIGDVARTGGRNAPAPRLGVRRNRIHLQLRVEHHLKPAILQLLAEADNALVGRRAAEGGRAVAEG